MNRLRALMKHHHRLAMALLMLALCIKAAIPGGFMIGSGAGVSLSVSICADASGQPRTMQLVLPAGEDHGSKQAGLADKAKPCAFSGLAKDGATAADALVLALALAFIVLISLAPARRLPLRAPCHLRPPLRGPPVTA